MTTVTDVSFVDGTTVQLRFELGGITHGIVTTDIPTNINIEDGGYAFAQSDSQYVGRVRGKDGQYYVPLDTYTPSDIDDLFDWSETGGVRTAPVDDPSRWSVTVDGEAVPIAALSRKANILETANTGWQLDYRTLQNVFVELDAPLAEGAQIEISFDDSDFDTVTTTYSPDTTVSEAIHVSLAGFDPDDTKTAYLSSWNGFSHDSIHERGGVGVPQVFEPGTEYQVIDDATGAIVLTGQTTLAQGINDGTNLWQNYALTDVLQMDLSDVTEAGNYHVVVDGVGRSQSFEVAEDHWADLFAHTFKGFYHKRSGIELTEEFTDAPRPRALHPEDGIVIHQTDVQIIETSEAWNGALPKPFAFWEGRLTGETLDDAWGGWHDAGDFDRRTQHMQTTRKLAELHEMQTDFSEGFDGGIPESSDGIPDLLNEAIWGSTIFRTLQKDDGGVPGGIESASYGSFGDSSFTDQRDLYVYAPDVWTSWEFAATAAKISAALEPYDAVEAAAWLQAGIAAFNWAEANVPADVSETDAGWLNVSRNLAAAELLVATQDPAYAQIFADTFVYGQDDTIEWFENQFEAAYVIANAPDGTADPALKSQALQVLRDRADWLLENGQNSGFGFITDPYAPYGWGNTASQPTWSADYLVRMHALTGDGKYLAPVTQDIDYALGANPLNMTFITGMDALAGGIRQPLTILDADSDVLGGTPAPGITLYGEHNVYDYGWSGWHSEMWEESWPNYYDAPVHESWNGAYGFVPVTEFTVMQGMEDMTFVTGYLAALAQGDASDDTTQVTVQDDANARLWSSYTDTLDADGVRIARVTQYDDGRVMDTTYDSGKLTSRLMRDVEDAHSYLTYTDSFDSTGLIATRQMTRDSGREDRLTYTDGTLSAFTMTDAANATIWDVLTQTYNSIGQRESQTITYDDGRLFESAFENGVRATGVMTDVEDAYAWANYVNSYDSAGNITARTMTYDDGTVTVIPIGAALVAGIDDGLLMA